jgi:integrase/recombinase XerC
MRITDAIVLFVSYLQFEKRYAKNTVRAYHDDLAQLAAFFDTQLQITQLEELTPSLLRTWLAQHKDEGMQARSLNRKMSSLRSFGRFLLQRQHISTNFASTLTAQKPGRRLPQFVDQSDLSKLWSHDCFGTDWRGQTAQLTLTLFYQTGIRLSELIGLKERHLGLEQCTIKVLGKGNKERILPCTPELMALMKAYMAQKRAQLKTFDADRLLVSPAGKPLYAKAVYNMVRQYLDPITTIGKRSPHVLRHSFATHLMNEGATLQAVKELLGHSSLAATQVYTHNTIEKLKAAHRQAHPKG